MAKPQQVQKLRKGRILTGKNFPAFADTFNYYGEFIENLKGDADIRPDSGSIQVDRTSPEHPVVRFVGDKAATVDSQLPDLHLSSAQSLWHDQQQYHELYNFQLSAISSFQLSDVNSNSYDLIVRDSKTDPSGKIVNYVKARDFLSATRLDSDTDATQNDMRSIQIVPHGPNEKRDYIQMYHFANPFVDIDSEMLKCTIAYGETRYVTRPNAPNDYPDDSLQFVCRHTATGDAKLVYDGIKIVAPPIYTSDVTDLCDVISDLIIHIDPGHDCSCNISALSAAVDDLSSDLSNYWKVGGTYDDNCYGQSIGDSSMNLAIDLDYGQLWYGSSMTLDWHACQLYDQNGSDGPGNLMVDWGDCIIYDKSQGQSIDWDSRLLKDYGGMPTVDWDNKLLNGDYGTAVDWHNHMLIPTGGSPTVEWSNCVLDDLQGIPRLNWDTRELIGDWNCPYGDFAIGDGFVLKIGNTTLSEAQLSAVLSLLSAVPAQLSGI